MRTAAPPQIGIDAPLWRFFQEQPITVFNKPLTKPETKTFEPSPLSSPDMKVPILNANLAVRDMGGIMRVPARHWLDYDSVAVAVLITCISMIALLVWGI